MILATVLSALLASTFARSMERVASMDPAQSRSIYDAHATALVYEPILAVDYKARPYRLTDGFCRLPEVSSDGLVYVFRLAHADAPLAAADVVRSLERLRDPKLVSPNGWIMKDVDTVVARDPQTVVVTLKRRCHYFPWLMAMPATGVVGPDCEGTGPYRLARWRKNHEMVFTRRPSSAASSVEGSKSFVAGVPSPAKNGFDTIRYLVIDDVSTQWLMFLKGEIDFLGEISRDNWDSIVGANGCLAPELEAQGVRLHSIASLDVLYIGMNMRDPVLGPNRKLR